MFCEFSMRWVSYYWQTPIKYEDDRGPRHSFKYLIFNCLVCNIGENFYQTLDNTFIKHWTIPLSNAGQYLYQTLTIPLSNVDNTFAKR